VHELQCVDRKSVLSATHKESQYTYHIMRSHTLISSTGCANLAGSRDPLPKAHAIT